MPKPFLTHDHGAVKVYRCYKDPTDPDNRMPSDWWFSTDPTDVDYDYPNGAQFDVRDVDPDGDSYMWKVHNGVTTQVRSTDAAIRRVIHRAIREGRLDEFLNA